MATLPTKALNLLRLSGIRSIRSGMKGVVHGITDLLKMGRQIPSPTHAVTLNPSREHLFAAALRGA